MKISHVDIHDVALPLKDGPYVMSYVTQTELRTHIIRIVTDNGKWGIGEIVRRPSIASGRAEALETPRLDGLSGVALAHLPAMINEWMEEGPMLRGLCFGVDTAMNDLICRSQNIPLHAKFGRAQVPFVVGYHSIAASDIDTMTGAVRAHPHHVIQVKLGVHSLSSDIARVQSVLDAAGPAQTVLADFNGALDVHSAISGLSGITDPRLFWEDPCLDYEDNCRVARALDVPVLFDMCMDDIGVFKRAIADGVPGVPGAVVIKPHFVGGLSTARKIMLLCADAGMKVRIDGPFSTQIGAAATLHLALTAPKNLLLCSADLTVLVDTPRDLLTNPDPGHFGVATGAGLGPLTDWPPY